MTAKRDRFLADIEKYKARYQKVPTEYLRKQLPRMTIKAASTAAKQILRERGQCIMKERPASRG